MARQITTTPETPVEFMKIELAAFASGDRNVDRIKLQPLVDGDESHNVPFITALCQSFLAKALAYYNAGVDANDRLERVAEISQTFREISFKKQNQTFTIASDNAGLTAQEAYKIGAEGCPPGTMCVDRTCVGSDREVG